MKFKLFTFFIAGFALKAITFGQGKIIDPGKVWLAEEAVECHQKQSWLKIASYILLTTISRWEIWQYGTFYPGITANEMRRAERIAKNTIRESYIVSLIKHVPFNANFNQFMTITKQGQPGNRGKHGFGHSLEP